MNRLFSKFLFPAFALVLILPSCSKSEEAKTEAVEELPMVKTSVVSAEDVNQLKSYTANIEADNLNNIAPATPNRIKTINVEVGDRVHKGQTLVTLDSSSADQIRINLDQLQRDYNRAVQLLEIGAGTQQTVDQLKAQLDATKTQLSNILENTVLISPINGVVTARNYDPGDMTGSLPVLTVGQLSPKVKVMINVSENDLSLVKKGMLVNITFDAFPGETFEGYVARIYPTVDSTTRTFQVEVDVNNPGERILPGMFGRVEFNLGTKHNVVVPDQAVVKQTGSGNKYVYVLKGDKVSFNHVQLGQRIGSAYEVLSGVEDGDTVVISGQTRLADGVQVQVVK